MAARTSWFSRRLLAAQTSGCSGELVEFLVASSALAAHTSCLSLTAWLLFVCGGSRLLAAHGVLIKSAVLAVRVTWLVGLFGCSGCLFVSPQLAALGFWLSQSPWLLPVFG